MGRWVGGNQRQKQSQRRVVEGWRELLSPHKPRKRRATCFGIEAKVKAQIRHEQTQGQEQRQGDLIALPTQVAQKTRDICGPPALVSRRREKHKYGTSKNKGKNNDK